MIEKIKYWISFAFLLSLYFFQDEPEIPKEEKIHSHNWQRMGLLILSMFFFFPSVTHASLTTNIVSYWKLDGNSNDSVASKNGTDVGITYSTLNGLINQGAGYTDSTGKITMSGYASTINTFSAWVNLSSAAAGDSRSVVLVYGTYLAFNTGKPEFYDGAWKVAASAISTGAWHMLTLTSDGSGSNLYLDGNATPIVTSATTNIFATTGDLDLGWRSDSYPVSGVNMQGDIDEVGTWSRVLSTVEIAQLYNSGAGCQYTFGACPAGGVTHPFIPLFDMIWGNWW